MADMAGGEPDDIDDLLRQVEALNSGTGVPAKPTPKEPAAPPPSAVEPARRESLPERAVGGLLPAAVAGAAIFALFLVLPFASSISGGLGAFLAVWVVWVLRGR
jgi:hypothetical protein